ncbi:FtsK/SpoIIIE family DNA translocase [Altibacter sp. HG106]|uniref:FtsK/SpoIIIE family DNA translocase n=1 Tax=Altibacter sp. HG106 TaxID=3023937 RepID=UPI00234FE0C1|nr:DNA translocase FtsK [Altibacter sp. HG106]MDC7995472.1 DNA translocase FtsK 4TM domain-containing protein [Altibacter sp. HG106]
MARKKKKTSKKSNTPRKKISLSLSKQQKIVLGGFLFFLGLALLLSFFSYFFTWQADQSEIGFLTDREVQAENWLNKFGNAVGHFFVYQGFGVAAFILAALITLTGVYFFFDYRKKALLKFWFWGLLVMVWIATFFGFFSEQNTLISGVVGFETNDWLQDYLGLTGAILVLAFLAIVYLVVRLKLTPEKVGAAFQRTKKEIAEDFTSENTPVSEDSPDQTDYEKTVVASVKEEEPVTPPIEVVSEEEDDLPEPHLKTTDASEDDITMEVEEAPEEEAVEENMSKKLVEDFGEFDPTLELSNFKYPTIELLKDYTAGKGITINQEELEENKNRIVQTLNNYKIGIQNIKATVGPTVTLYEIIPEAGIRISKIKNLEDDIALSLSALGIRIIAPIPGRGTIGIEVPNKKPKIVSMRSVIASPKFQNAEMELPLALGKTISNETFVVDLAKMPHLLMAGATGQGKSVGLNAILTSLLYKKHPAEVKFVLVDPKKVELTLFNKIERHYLAKLPDTEEAIITDTNKVINTLNSLCIEMDERYDLLKDAMCRNIKEYNTKFKKRKLNPNDGHRFLPYIVLVIDEFADLIMTAGKEVETPIARLAQLARAIGIHLIIATQRPSVNVITGIIKANFPARIAFRVTSKIDSRTILDSSGADQLIGRGDMLYTQGNDLTRLQCAFVDTPEVSDITDYIGSQKAYPDAHLLPEYVGEEGGTTLDDIIEERDKLFREAAEVLVIAQQGSASLLQRKLKLGYNRAGRIIDQLEAAGIVGPFEGSKARQVLVPTIEALNQLLQNESNDN